MTDFTAPIALFVYNRPEHTRRTLESLRANEGAGQSRLYVFADGPSRDLDKRGRDKLANVRELIRQEPWCGTVEITEASENRGLARSICSGVNTVLEAHDRVIVLEDDLETSPGFLRYINNALRTYEDSARVYQVSGFMVPNRPWSAPTGFLRVTTSWGWGTWKRAWKDFRYDADYLLREVRKKGSHEFDLDGHSFHYNELKRNVRGELRTWAVRWYASVFLRDGLCLYPRRTLIRNIGFDGSGVNCHKDRTERYSRMRLANGASVSKQSLIEDPLYLAVMQRHYDKLLKTWTGTRLQDRIKKKLARHVQGRW